MSTLAERLGEVGLYTEVTLELEDGTTVEGQVSPIDYTPDEHLRLELRSFDDESGRRYEVHADYDGEWETPAVRRVVPADGEEWEELGDLADFSVAE